jgi:hypothetical protein
MAEQASPFNLEDPRDAETDEDIFKEAKEFLAQVIDTESANRTQAIQAWNFRDGEQWPADLTANRGPERLQMTINHTDVMVTRIENNIKQQRPRIKCHPVGDGADIEKAKTVNGLVRHIENYSKASVAYDTGVSSSLTIGWGYWRIIPEYIDGMSFDQELKIVAVPNTFTVYRDPDSVLPDGSDSMRYAVTEMVLRTKYKRMYPDAKNVEWSQVGLGEGDLEWENKDQIRLCEYFRIIEKPQMLFKMIDQSTRFRSDFAPGVLKAALDNPSAYGFAVDLKGEAIKRRSFKRQVQWKRINGREVVDKRDLPGKYIPIIAVQGNTLHMNGKTRRSGKIKNMMEPARAVNYWTTMFTERLALTPQAPWVTAEGQTTDHPEWDQANRKPYSQLVYKPVMWEGTLVPAPQRQQPAGVEAGMMEAGQSAEHTLMAIAGMPHEPGQDSAGQVVSGKAIERRQDLADDNNYQYYDNQTISIAFTGTILVDLIPYYYDTPRQQRIIGEDGVPTIVAINESMPDGSKKNDLSVGKYDIVMDTGPGYDTKRQEGSEALTSMLATPMGEVITKAAPDIVMRSYDFPYADEIADRLLPQSPEGMKKAMAELPKQAQAIVQSLQGQLQQAGQHIQQLEADLKYGLTKSLHEQATKLQIENLRDNRAEQDTHTDAFTKIEDTHTEAQTALSVAEINTGGKILQSHVTAAHDKEAAKALAANAEKVERSNGAAK